MELTTASITQGCYEVATGRTTLHSGLGPAHPMAAAVNVSAFLGRAFVLCNEGKRPGLTSHIFDCSADYWALYLVRSQKENAIKPMTLLRLTLLLISRSVLRGTLQLPRHQRNLSIHS